jgi:hypothetical protein
LGRKSSLGRLDWVESALSRLGAVLFNWLLTDDPGDEPSTTPKLNCGAFEKLFGFFDSFAVVLANEAPVPNKMFLTSDEIGSVI